MKRLTKTRLACIAAITALAVVACDAGKVDAEALDGVMHPVLDRHDAYVIEDESLEEVERSTALRSSEIIRRLVDEAKE